MIHIWPPSFGFEEKNPEKNSTAGSAADSEKLFVEKNAVIGQGFVEDHDHVSLKVEEQVEVGGLLYHVEGREPRLKLNPPLTIFVKASIVIYSTILGP